MQPRDPAALGRRLAEALPRALAALARNAAFAAVLALPMTFVLHASYGLAFLFVLGGSAALEMGRTFLRRASAPSRAREAAPALRALERRRP